MLTCLLINNEWSLNGLWHSQKIPNSKESIHRIVPFFLQNIYTCISLLCLVPEILKFFKPFGPTWFAKCVTWQAWTSWSSWSFLIFNQIWKGGVGESKYLWKGGITCFLFCLKKRVLIFFHLKCGVGNIFCSLKFTKFLKTVIFYVKQITFMVLTHSEGVLTYFCEVRVGVKFFCLLLDVLKLFSKHPDPKSQTLHG